MPCTHLCGTSLHPQRPKHRVEGAAQCPAHTSVALLCTLSSRNTGSIHPQRPKYTVEGAAQCPARISVALPCTLSTPTLLLPQWPKYWVEGAATCPARTSVALPCTLSGPNTGLRGQYNALHASLRHFPAPSAAEIPGRGGSTMPCTHLCGTSLHPQPPKYRVEGAALCPARTSVALLCTLNRRNNGLLGKK